jgi:hypothetical protein
MLMVKGWFEQTFLKFIIKSVIVLIKHRLLDFIALTSCTLTSRTSINNVLVGRPSRLNLAAPSLVSEYRSIRSGEVGVDIRVVFRAVVLIKLIESLVQQYFDVI